MPNNKMKVLRVLSVVISIIALIISLIALGATIYKDGYKEGFNSCIEENNLYERYETNGKQEK